MDCIKISLFLLVPICSLAMNTDYHTVAEKPKLLTIKNNDIYSSDSKPFYLGYSTKIKFDSLGLKLYMKYREKKKKENKDLIRLWNGSDYNARKIIFFSKPHAISEGNIVRDFIALLNQNKFFNQETTQTDKSNFQPSITVFYPSKGKYCYVEKSWNMP